MATTDTRPGFRLPWSSDRADADQTGSESAESAESTESVADPNAVATDSVASDPTDASAGNASPVASDPSPAAEASAVVAEPAAEVVETPAPVAVTPEPAPAPAPVRKPNKFLADLTRAMQATAAAARAESLERFTADAKAATEQVHAVAAQEATELRRAADEDVAGIRDWSKAEIARIREVTENRISGRKSELEGELETHAAVVARRIEQVTARVAAFEAEMAAFYERLSTEEDPTRFAAMAEQLPEAPSLETEMLDSELPAAPTMVVEPVPAIATVLATTEPQAAARPDVMVGTAEAMTHAAAAEAIRSDDPASATTDTDAASAAEAEAAAAEAEAFVTLDADPRVSIIGSAPDFDAAEAEAALAAEATGEDSTDEIPTIADEVLAARLAGLVPDEANGSNPLVTTKVIVTGLVSVASIAGFKRHLARLQGVTTVGVSSGPEGEFVFSVHHLPVADLAAGIAELPGFDARVTDQAAGQLTVSARDPEVQN